MFHLASVSVTTLVHQYVLTRSLVALAQSKLLRLRSFD